MLSGGDFSSNLNTVDKSQIRSTKSTTKGGSGGGLGVASPDWPEGNSPCKSLIINHPCTKPFTFFLFSVLFLTHSPSMIKKEGHTNESISYSILCPFYLVVGSQSQLGLSTSFFVPGWLMGKSEHMLRHQMND